jgi:casein kinase II subunit alpha
LRYAKGEKAYPLGCSQKPQSYYDYENNQFPSQTGHVRSVDDYALTRRLGTGKFSDVFEAVDVNLEKKIAANKPPSVVDPRTLVVVKCLKPVAERKIRREIMVLERAAQVPNIARLIALVVSPNYFEKYRGSSTDLPRMPALVMQHAGPHSQWFCHSADNNLSSTSPQAHSFLTDYEIRYYLYHLLSALDGLHSTGIMHRDVKPRNVLINRRLDDGMHRAPLTLIDLGLADFYHPSVPYNVRVASRHYKAPELLLGNSCYDYAIDIWGVGCILAGLLFHREPFFRGRDNVEQLHKIIVTLGIDDMWAYVSKYNIEVTENLRRELETRYDFEQNPSLSRRSKRVPWSEYWQVLHSIVPHKKGSKVLSPSLPSVDALDLLDHLLVYDHEQRWTAQQAMQHRFFDVVRERVQAELRSYETLATKEF